MSDARARPTLAATSARPGWLIELDQCPPGPRGLGQMRLPCIGVQVYLDRDLREESIGQAERLPDDDERVEVRGGAMTSQRAGSRSASGRFAAPTVIGHATAPRVRGALGAAG